jgi:hypothetical protein
VLTKPDIKTCLCIVRVLKVLSVVVARLVACGGRSLELTGEIDLNALNLTSSSKAFPAGKLA